MKNWIELKSTFVLLVFSGLWPWSRTSRSSWCVRITKTRRLTSTASPVRRRPAPCAKCSENTRTVTWLRWTTSTPGRRYDSPEASHLPKASRFHFNHSDLVPWQLRCGALTAPVSFHSLLFLLVSVPQSVMETASRLVRAAAGQKFV